MTHRQKQLLNNLVAFFFLFLISLYRQISFLFIPKDPFRTYILYVGYVLLIMAWGTSIHFRVTQRNMEIFLLIEGGIMLLGVTIRFLQDTLWNQNIELLRTSGLYLAATILPLFLLGIYSALGIGQNDNFIIPRKWYGLCIPVFIIIILLVLDNRLHFMYYISPDEGLNVSFHPNFGIYIMVGLCVLFILIRTYLIYNRNRYTNQSKKWKLIISLFEPFLGVVFCLKYFINSFQAPAFGGEIVELYAKIAYIEAITWEFYMYLGLVPVNTEYREIFEHATIGMQIIEDNGNQILSETAETITEELLKQLKEKDFIVLEPGKELHAHRYSNGLFLWNQDVSLLQGLIEELNQTAEMLEQEGQLLEAEIRTKNQEASLLAKNKIYDELTTEVRRQLDHMTELAEIENPSKRQLQQLVLLGTYVKRRCNLRLIEKEYGAIRIEDLKLSFDDMISAIIPLGIKTKIVWSDTAEYTADFICYIFDCLCEILEKEVFEMEAISIYMNSSSVEYTVQRDLEETFEISMPYCDGLYFTQCERNLNGYRWLISERGDIGV